MRGRAVVRLRRQVGHSSQPDPGGKSRLRPDRGRARGGPAADRRGDRRRRAARRTDDRDASCRAGARAAGEGSPLAPRIACQPRAASLSSAMFPRLFRGVAPLFLILGSAASAQSDPPVTPADLRRHIDVLASDAFEGRAPGTAGETLTTDYIVAQMRARGLEPAGEGGTWLQPVVLVEREAGPHQVVWTGAGGPIAFDQGDVVLIGREARQ